MAQHVSPGVFTKIIDLSEYVQNVPSTIAFLPIITESGRDNELIFTNSRDFFLDFGEPNINYAGKAFGQGPYVADSFLKQSDALYVVRCLPEDASWSNLVLTQDDTLDVVASSMVNLSSDASLEALQEEADIAQIVNADFTTISLAGSEYWTFNDAIADFYVWHTFETTAVAEVADLTFPDNDSGQLNTGEYFTISGPATTYWVWFDIDGGATPPTPTTETLVPVAITSAMLAPAIATAVQVALDAQADFGVPAPAGADTITVTNASVGAPLVATANVNMSTPVVIDVTTPGVTGGTAGVDPSQSGTGILVAVVDSDVSAGIATKTASAIGGSAAAVTLLNNGDDIDITNTTLGPATVPTAGDSGFTVSATTPGSSGENYVVFYGEGRGEFYDNFQLQISEHANPELPRVYILDILQKQLEPDETGADQYGVIDTFEVSFDYRAKDRSGESMFIEDIVNRFSRNLRCLCNRDLCLAAEVAELDWTIPFVAGAPINLDEGDSGSFFDSNGKFDTLGTESTLGQSPASIMAKTYTGTLVKTDGKLLYDVLNTEDIYFSIVFDAGYPYDVKASIDTLIQSRLDCVAIVDQLDNLSVGDAIDVRDGIAGTAPQWNTKYAALYEPYSQIFDKYTGRDIWLTPVYHMANIIPFTDNVAEIWWAPAGFNRATITSIKKLRYSPLLDERDQLYLKQINPIVKFNVGYTVWGQLTTQKRPSALQDLNIVRLVLYIKRALEQFCKYYIFELNDDQTWSKVKVEINKFLKNIQNKRGLYSFSVNVGATEYELKAKQFHVDIILEPTRVVEQIYLNFFIK